MGSSFRFKPRKRILGPYGPLGVPPPDCFRDDRGQCKKKASCKERGVFIRRGSSLCREGGGASAHGDSLMSPFRRGAKVGFEKGKALRLRPGYAGRTLGRDLL